MLRKLLLSGACAMGSAMALAVGGCSSQSGASVDASSVSPVSGQMAGAATNQGRFPTPTYSQEQQPTYALTGSNQTDWAPAPRIVDAGNARVLIP